MSNSTNETKITTQKIAEKIVENHIYTNQTLLVEDCLKTNFFTYDDIQNLFVSDDETLENLQIEGYQLSEITQTLIDDAKTAHTIYEWWLVSEWLAVTLEHNKQPVLENAYGTWWGRTCSGQAIYMDNIIQEIALLTS